MGMCISATIWNFSIYCAISLRNKLSAIPAFHRTFCILVVVSFQMSEKHQIEFCFVVERRKYCTCQYYQCWYSYVLYPHRFCIARLHSVQQNIGKLVTSLAKLKFKKIDSKSCIFHINFVIFFILSFTSSFGLHRERIFSHLFLQHKWMWFWQTNIKSPHVYLNSK